MKHVSFFTVLFMSLSSIAFADGGVDASPDAEPDAAMEDAGDAAVPLACDGALCDTTNGGTCDVSPDRPDFPGGSCALLFGFSALVVGVVRRARKESSR